MSLDLLQEHFVTVNTILKVVKLSK